MTTGTLITPLDKAIEGEIIEPIRLTYSIGVWAYNRNSRIWKGRAWSNGRVVDAVAYSVVAKAELSDKNEVEK